MDYMAQPLDDVLRKTLTKEFYGDCFIALVTAFGSISLFFNVSINHTYKKHK